MKDVARSKRIGLRMLLAFLALLMLCAPAAQAQAKQALTQDAGSTTARCGGNQLSLSNYYVFISMRPMRFIEFIFTNSSSSPCILKGYPSLEFLGKAGRHVRRNRAVNGTTRLRDYKDPPNGVMIAPGKTARFFVDYLARYDEAREKPCPTYRSFRVTAPGTERVFVKRFRGHVIEVCSELEVSPVFEP